MKYVLLSADNCPSVYSVPDIVADNLGTYCDEFCCQWLWESPHAAEYRVVEPEDPAGWPAVCYCEKDFIKYLNEWIFPEQPSTLIETLDGVETNTDVPEKYKGCEWFNF